MGVFAYPTILFFLFPLLLPLGEGEGEARRRERARWEPKRQRTGDLRLWLRRPAAVVEDEGEVGGTAPRRVHGRATEGPPE